MPTWAQEFGGPMESYQVNQVTNFVMNWGENPELCTAPTPEPVVWPDNVTELPEGDPANGESLYSGTYACASCHGDPTVEGSNIVGPWLGNIAVDGATRVEGQSADEYIYHSVLDVNAFISPICANDAPCAEPSQMRADFANVMSQQDLADIIAYLMTLSN
jgi:mono/diheme cytochrome c family protein